MTSGAYDAEHLRGPDVWLGVTDAIDRHASAEGKEIPWRLEVTGDS